MLSRLLFFIVLLISISSQADSDCFNLNEKVQKEANQIAPVWILSVQSKHRVYFHSAPNNACKIKDLFIVSNDTVTGYDFYRDSSQQEWIYVIYYSKRLDLENEIVEGWIKFENLKNLSRSFPES